MSKFSSYSLQDAFVEFLNGSYLFKSMLKDDQGAEMIHCIPGVAPLLQTYPLVLLLSNPCNQPIDNDLGKHYLNSLTLHLHLSIKWRSCA